MRTRLAAVLFCSLCLPAAAESTAQQSGAADLCQELLAYAEAKVQQGGPEGPGGASASAPPLRPDGKSNGTQGGGSVDPSTSGNAQSQAAAPPTAPVATGAAPEAAASAHSSGSGSGGNTLPGGVSLQQVRDTAAAGDRRSCRATVQAMRRAGGDLPAALLALGAYEPDPALRR